MTESVELLDGVRTVVVEGWQAGGAYIAMFSSRGLTDHRAVWRQIWDTGVGLLITLISSTGKDDMAQVSTFVGSFQLQVETETQMGDMIVRTLRISNRGVSKTITQIVFTWFGPDTESLLALVRETSEQWRQSGCQGPVLVWSAAEVGQDPAIVWMCLDTMSRQMRSTGDTNLSHYSRHLATTHGLSLSSSQLYTQLHDILAWAIQHDQLDYQQPNIR